MASPALPAPPNPLARYQTERSILLSTLGRTARILDRLSETDVALPDDVHDDVDEVTALVNDCLFFYGNDDA